MIKKLSFLLALLCLLPILLACGEVDDGRLSVVATNFAAYDFAREIVGDKTDTVKVEFLAAGDAHSFNPTFGDMTKIQGADLFLYVGGISDAPIDTLLAGVEGVNTLKLLDCVTPLYEKDEHEDGDEHEHGKTALDEHVWTSPKNAGLIVGAILEKIVALDPINEADYRKNAATYAAKLTKLDEAFEMLFKEQTKAVVFGDRFPLLYFAEAYKMRYEAAFPSCHATSEPTDRARQSGKYPHRILYRRGYAHGCRPHCRRIGSHYPSFSLLPQGLGRGNGKRGQLSFPDGTKLRSTEGCTRIIIPHRCRMRKAFPYPMPFSVFSSALPPLFLPFAPICVRGAAA